MGRLLPLYLLLSFHVRSQDHVSNELFPRTAIVFTGQFGRVRYGLRLIEQGRIDRLFISGVNGGAGIDPDRFAEQFDLSQGQRQQLMSGAIALATEANTTIENAFEALCWLQENKSISSVVLITSKRHMARAYIALRKVQPRNVKIFRLTVSEASAHNDYRGQAEEFVKYSATWLMLSVPDWLRLNGYNFCVNDN